MPSPFTGPLSLTHLDLDWRRWRVNQALRYDVGHEGSGKTIVVPDGFVTDGASIPRFLWWLLPAWGSYSRAAVVHDYLCTVLAGGGVLLFCQSRAEADRIFLEAMKVCGTSRPVRWAMFLAVRGFAIAKGIK